MNGSPPCNCLSLEKRKEKKNAIMLFYLMLIGLHLYNYYGYLTLVKKNGSPLNLAHAFDWVFIEDYLMGYQIPACDCFFWLITATCFYRIEERDVLKQLVDQALACRISLTEIINFALAYFDKDFGVVSEKLTIALKVLGEASIIYCWYVMLLKHLGCIVLFLLRTWIDISSLCWIWYVSLVHNCL